MQSNNMIIPDIYFSAFRSMIDVLNVYLGGLGRLQAYQIDAMQRLRAEASDASRQMDPRALGDDQRWVPAGFARDQMERAARYWSGFYSTAYQNQIEVVKETQSKAMALASDMRERLDAAPKSAEPMLSALRIVFDAAQSTYAAGMRATEEVERLTASQAEEAGNAAKSSAAKRKRAA